MKSELLNNKEIQSEVQNEVKNKDKRRKVISDSDSEEDLVNNEQETAEAKGITNQTSQIKTEKSNLKGKRHLNAKAGIENEDDMSVSSDSSELGNDSIGSAFQANSEAVKEALTKNENDKDILNDLF